MASTMLNVAVAAPVPSASVRIAAVVKPRFLAAIRAAYARSRRSCSVAAHMMDSSRVGEVKAEVVPPDSFQFRTRQA